MCLCLYVCVVNVVFFACGLRLCFAGVVCAGLFECVVLFVFGVWCCFFGGRVCVYALFSCVLGLFVLCFGV